MKGISLNKDYPLKSLFVIPALYTVGLDTMTWGSLSIVNMYFKEVIISYSQSSIQDFIGLKIVNIHTEKNIFKLETHASSSVSCHI
jgi:hypothetical protein